LIEAFSLVVDWIMRRGAGFTVGRRSKAKASAAKVPPDPWDTMRLARESAERAEAIAQSRLNNFLVADSIVFLSWATLFNSSRQMGRVPVLLALALLSSILSITWIALGRRQWKFIELRWAVARTLEERVDEAHTVYWYVAKLRETGELEHSTAAQLRLPWYLRCVTSRNVLVLAPAVFLVASLFLIWSSLV